MTRDSIKKQITALGIGGCILYYTGRFFDKLQQQIIGRSVMAFGKVKKDCLVFKNRQDQDYTDNPRALFEYLMSQGCGETYQMIWLVSDKSKFKGKHYKNVKFFTAENKYGWSSPLSYYYGARAEYFFYSHNGAGLNRFRCKGQKVINLWHGCGYKGAEHGTGVKAQTSVKADFDYALVPGSVFAKTKARVWNCGEEKLLLMGYPRYDWMLHPSLKKEEMLHRLFQESWEKAVLWMPTFRKSALKGCRENEIELPFLLPGLKNEKELRMLNEVLRDQKELLIIKKHPLETDWNKTEMLSNIRYVTEELLENIGVNLYELVGVSDGLISDYSSIAVDYLLLDRPLGYVLTDFESYREKRGFVFENPLDYMPGEKIYDLKDLTAFLENVGEGRDLYKDRRKELLPVMHSRTENYCARVADYFGLRRKS